MQETARTVAEVSRECKLEVVVDDYIESFKPFLMDIMYSWSKGASFRDICLMTGTDMRLPPHICEPHEK